MFKNKKTILSFILISCCCMVSCHHDDPIFDPALLVGKWVSGTEYYRYDADGTGVTWDTSDDVSEEEGQPYTWQFNETNNRLTLLHQMEMGGVIPKYYTVTKLTEDLLQYKDQYNQSFTYNRVR